MPCCKARGLTGLTLGSALQKETDEEASIRKEMERLQASCAPPDGPVFATSPGLPRCNCELTAAFAGGRGKVRDGKQQQSAFQADAA